MRYVPIPFPCGCVCRSGVPEYGAGLMVTENCAEHSALHRSDTRVEIDESSILGCSCPGCEFGRFAAQRRAQGEEQSVVANWGFLARLKMRRVSEIVGRPAQRRKR